MRNSTLSYGVILGCFLTLSQCVLADRLVQAAIEQPVLGKSLLLAISRPGERLVAAGEQGVIIYSDDGAISWQQAKVPSSTLLTGLHFFDNQLGWAVGHDGVVLHTQDGGQSWRKQLDGTVINQLRVDAIAAELAQQSGLENVDAELVEGLGYQLDDAKAALKEGPSTPLLDLFFLDAMNGYVLGAYGLFLKTSDGGETWVYQGHKLPNPENMHLNRMYQSQQGALLILGEAGLLIQSLDKGASWNVVDVPYQGSFFSAVEADALYLMGLRGTVLKRILSDSGEVDWRKLDIGSTATINDSVVVDGVAYLVGQGGVILRMHGESFEPFLERGLRSYSGVESEGHFLIVVGEKGVTRIDLTGGAQQ